MVPLVGGEDGPGPHVGGAKELGSQISRAVRAAEQADSLKSLNVSYMSLNLSYSSLTMKRRGRTIFSKQYLIHTANKN